MKWFRLIDRSNWEDYRITSIDRTLIVPALNPEIRNDLSGRIKPKYNRSN